MTHKSLFALLIALFSVIATSCSDDDDEDLIGHPVIACPEIAFVVTWSEDIPVKPA